MNFITAKKPSDIKLEGIRVDFHRVDDTLKTVTLTDAKGNIARIIGQYSSAQIEVPAPPKMEKRFVLRGELPVIGDIEKLFESKFDAEEAKRELDSKTRADLDLSITEEEVEIKEEAAVSGDTIPF